jgi:hypothetical protein
MAITAAGRYVLAHLLDVVPDFTSLEPFRDRSISAWIREGSFSTASSTPRSLILNVNQREYAAHLIAEIHHLLNQASEHRAHLMQHVSNAASSPSWLLVSIYYLSLYVAMAWSRAVNCAVLYLDQPILKRVCGSEPAPHAGAYHAILSIDNATGAATLQLKKAKHSHFHEAVWVTLHNKVEEAAGWVRALSIHRRPTKDELQSLAAFELFGGLQFQDPMTWPSQLRNSVNYRPGFSYRTVLRHNFLRTNGLLGQPALANLSQVIDYGSRAKIGMRGALNPIDVANDSIKLMIAQSLILESTIDEAANQLLVARELECSAPRLRSQFNVRHCATNSVLHRVDSASDD